EPGGEAAVPLVAVDRRLVPGADDAQATGDRVVDGLDGPLQPLGAPLLGLGPRALSLLVLLLDLLLAGAGPVPLRPGRGAGRLPGRRVAGQDEEPGVLGDLGRPLQRPGELVDGRGDDEQVVAVALDAGAGGDGHRCRTA